VISDAICHREGILAIQPEHKYPKYFGYNPNLGVYPNLFRIISDANELGDISNRKD